MEWVKFEEMEPFIEVVTQLKCNDLKNYFVSQTFVTAPPTTCMDAQRKEAKQNTTKGNVCSKKIFSSQNGVGMAAGGRGHQLQGWIIII